MSYRPTRRTAGMMTGLAMGLLVVGGHAAAATITWTDWTSITSGASGSASGTMGSNSVTFAGPNIGGNTAGTFFWGPASTYIGGVVGNPPCTGTTSCVGDIINLNGGTPPTTETLRFSSPVTNPVFAIWSLGAPGSAATLTFPAGTAPSIQSTGTNTTYGFVSLTASGNTVSGQEGNGTFILPGTFSSIAFNASFENYYGFTVGTAGPLSAPVPEPGTLGLLASGLLAFAGAARRKAKKQ